MCVPSRISDTVIRHASKYRSKERIPALTYLHWSNLASITRSSQPLVGLNNRSMQDEKLIEAIFTSHLFADPESSTAQAAIAAGRSNVPTGNAATDRGNVMAIYGATTTNLIIDARPTTNAMANRAKGAGTENMEHYKGCKKVYLGVDNIHVMRDSLQRITNALRTSEPPWTFGLSKTATQEQERGVESEERRIVNVSSEKEAPPLDHIALKRSGWLKHISALLEGTSIITRNIHVNNSHVLIHCSDGWDRTSQLAALAEICLDPYYRTMRGFAVLVEKDWCSYGHRFWDRCGHASSEKYFETAHGYGDDDSEEDKGEEIAAAGGFEPQAAANAFWGFTKQITANFQSSSDSQSGHGRGGAHLKEISPVFHQFLDCIWQIMRQNPNRFEYNEKWLLDIFDGVYECKYGTFLFNSEGERNGLSEVGMKPSASTKSTSIWDYLLDERRRSVYVNPNYKKDMDTDSKRSGADMGVLLPNSRDVGFWGGVFRRDGKEMNRLVQAEAEERKRLVDALEKQRVDDLNGVSAGQALLGPSEVDGVTVGPIVENSQEDPVMRNGVVDLSTGDPQRLAYQPYQSRQRQGASSKAIDNNFTRPIGTTGASAAMSSMPSSDEGVHDATAKMKNIFMGWGAKFQEAYNSATAGLEEQPKSVNSSLSIGSHSNSRAFHDAHQSLGPSNGLLSADVGRTLEVSSAPHSAPHASISDGEVNPWAAPVSKGGHDRLPKELVPNVDSNGTKPYSKTIYKEPEIGTKEKEHTNADYDPLGVGTI